MISGETWGNHRFFRCFFWGFSQEGKRMDIISKAKGKSSKILPPDSAKKMSHHDPTYPTFPDHTQLKMVSQARWRSKTLLKTMEKIVESSSSFSDRSLRHLSSNAALDVKLVLSFALKGASRRQPSHLQKTHNKIVGSPKKKQLGVTPSE